MIYGTHFDRMHFELYVLPGDCCAPTVAGRGCSFAARRNLSSDSEVRQGARGRAKDPPESS